MRGWDDDIMWPNIHLSRAAAGGVKKRRKKPGPKKGSKERARKAANCPCLEVHPRTADSKCPMPAGHTAALRVKGVGRCEKHKDDQGQLQVVANYTAEEEQQRLALAPDEPDYPREKPVNYTKWLARVENDMNWYGKHDAHGDQRQLTLGIEIAIKIENQLRKLSANLDKSTHRSFVNRVHTLTIMQEMIEAATTTEGSRVSSSCRRSAYDYDNIFVGAVQKLTDAQSRRLKVLDRGTWVKDLCEMIKQYDKYCVWPRLKDALVLLDPEAAEEIALEETPAP